MKKTALILTIIIGLPFLWAIANPLPEIQVESVGAFPPYIGVGIYGDSIDISGDTIFTSSGIAIIDSGLVPDEYGSIFLDSSNTTGFTLDPEGDWVSMHFEWGDDGVGFGTCGTAPGLFRGGGIGLGGYCRGFYAWSFHFSAACWGNTNVIINEINSHGSWDGNSNFIELYNKSDSVISLTDWRVVCDTIYNLPSDADIQSHSYYIIDRLILPESFDLDFARDNIYLVKPYSPYMGLLVDQVGWSSDHGENICFMRYPDGDVDTSYWGWDYRGCNDESSDTFENGFPSRGAPNRHESPGFVVIGTRAVGGEGSIDLYWTNPIWDPTFNNVKAVRSDVHFPETPDDGQVVYTGANQHVTDFNLPPNQWYYYTVFARNDGGEYSIPTDESRVSIYLGENVGVDENILPERITYLRAYPNPFNPTTTIDFGLIESSDITLSIYNLLGQRVATVYKGLQEAGEHNVTWNASSFPSGVYFARLEAGGFSENVKMVLLR